MKTNLVAKAMFEILLVVSLSFVISLSFSSKDVFADEARVCCERAIMDGEVKYCQYTEESNCDPDITYARLPSPCESTSICAPVCCNVNSLGYYASGGQGCFRSVPMNACVNDLHGTPIAGDPLCAGVSECQKGCCVMGSQCLLSTQEGCQNLTSNYPDLELNYRADIVDEVSCGDICRSATRGCCVTDVAESENSGCGMVTYSECQAQNGDFFEGINCIDLPEENTKCDHCKPTNNQFDRGCAPELDGGEDVYLYDKCGNPVRVASDGDCSYLAEGTLCRENNETSGASCESINCKVGDLWDNPFVDEDGDCCLETNPESGACSSFKDPGDVCWRNDNLTSTRFNDNTYRLNGESWCEYDTDSGPARDLPGSRHFTHWCFEGREQVIPCADYREEFCLQFDGLDVSQARCYSSNSATQKCTDFTDEASCTNLDNGPCLWIPPNTGHVVEDVRRIEETRCQEAREELNDSNAVCTFNTERAVNEASGAEEAVGKCVPLVPPGTRGDESFCDPADLSLESYWSEWGWGDGWDCESGCDLFTNKFAYGQNFYCKSLGDCGANFNLAGKWSNTSFIRTGCEVSYGNGLEHVNSGGEDYDRDYGEEDADDLVAGCLDILPDPGSYSVRAESFVNLSRYKNSLMIHDPDFGGIGMNPGSLAGYIIGGIGAAFGLSVYLSVQITATLAASATAAAAAAAGTATAAAASTAATTATTTAQSAAAFGPYGYVAALVIIAIAASIILTADSSTEQVDFDCKAWVPPDGGDNCNLCYEPGYREYVKPDGTTDREFIDLTAGGRHSCTDYLCWSLGKSCEYKETEEGPRCLNSCDSQGAGGLPSPDIDISPYFEQLNANRCRDHSDPAAGHEINCLPSNERIGYSGGFDVKYVKENTNLVIALNTSELAVCRWSWNRTTNYDEMSGFFDQVAGSYNQTLTLRADEELLPEERKTMWVMCRDLCENNYPVPYSINIEVSKMQDFGSPMLLSIDPPDGSPTRWNSDTKQVVLRLNEKAKCRWSNANVPYDLMNITTEKVCDQVATGCQPLVLTGLQPGFNTFFIRCKDYANNTNSDALPTNNGYNLFRSDSLNITSVLCKNRFGDQCGIIYDLNFTLEVITIGGGYGGTSICKLNGVDFLNTNSSIHTQVIGPRPGGDYSDHVRCRDNAGNEAEVDVNYTFIVDNAPPEIVKINTQSGVLNVLTNEVATCKYAVNSSVIYNDMEQFAGTGDLWHSTSVENLDYLHVKCGDRFNHVSSVDVYIVRGIS